MATPDGPRFQRLERALELWNVWRATGSEPVEAFLARHADLRDLLEPLCDETAQPPRPATAVPTAEIPGWILGHELGRGGMGVVYAATRATDGRPAAVKLMSGTRIASATATERFEREARILQRLDHPGIVRCLEFVRTEEHLCIAMERIDGVPLDRVIARLREIPAAALTAGDLEAAVAPGSAARVRSAGSSPSYVERVVELVAAVGDALECAHSHGVVHRDVKPANVLVRVDGRPVLTDFGIARADDLPGLTLTGDFAGTPYYVSPEQAMARRAPVDHRTDVFSLGVLLYELLTLRRPFDARSTQEVLGRIVAKEPVDPTRSQPGVTPGLSAIVFRALEKDPDNRYPSAAAFATDLRAFVARATVVARRTPLPVRAWRACRRAPARTATAVAVLVVVVSGIVWVTEMPRLAAARAVERAARLESLLEVAFLELSEGDPEAAVPAARDALELVPDSVEARHALCVALVLSDREAEAHAELDAARPPGGTDSPDHRRIRAWMHLYAGRKSVADALLADLPPPAGPVSCFLGSNLELVLAERGEHERFATAFELQLRSVLQDPAPRRLHLAQLAHLAGHLRDRAVGAQVAAALIELWPDSAHAWFWSGYAVAGHDRAAAIAAYRRAVALQPDFSLALLNLGASLEKVGDHDSESEAITRRALALRPHDAIVRYNLGVVLQKTGREEESREAFRDALRVRPGYPEAHNNLGTLELAAGATDTAIAHFEQALATRETYPEAHLNLANALQSIDRDDEAIAHLERALVLRPGYANAHVLLGMVHSHHRRHADAVPHWLKGVAARPALPQLHRMCADALRAAGAHAELAAEALRWARQDPRHPDRWQELRDVLADPATPAAARDLQAVLELARSAATAAGAGDETTAALARLLLACAPVEVIRAKCADVPHEDPLAAVVARALAGGDR